MIAKDKAKPIVVYILECVDGTLYTGWTNDLKKRVAAHNDGSGSKYTRSKRPVRVVYSEEVPDKSTALKREREIKSMSRENKLRLLSIGISTKEKYPNSTKTTVL